MADYRAIARQYANQFGIPADLFMRQIQAESAWDPTALSPAGAIGLGQLMPTTAQELGVDIMNPQDNLYGAAKYLRQMYDRFGDWRTALAAYNAGPGRVEQYGGIPPFEETQNYVSSILDEQDVRGGQTMPTMPQEQRPSGLLEMMGVQRQGTGGPQGDLPFYQRDRFKDFAGRLAMAANTLSQRPDPTVPQVVLGAQQSRKANRTAEWLAQQPGGAPYAKLILTDPSLAGQALASWQAKQAGPTFTQKTGAELGLSGPQAGMLFNVGADGKITQIGGAGTTINMPGQAPAEDALREKLMQKRGETWASMIDAGTTSAASMADLNVLQELAPLAPSGALSGRIAQAFPEFNDVAALRESIVKRVAPTLRVAGSGSTSDIEFAAMLDSLGSLRNTPEANMAIIGLMQTKAQFNIDRANIIRQYSTGALPYEQANEQIMALEQKAKIPSQVQSIIDQYTDDTSEAPGPDIVTDSAGIQWRYKGTGDRNDQANYERID